MRNLRNNITNVTEGNEERLVKETIYKIVKEKVEAGTFEKEGVKRNEIAAKLGELSYNNAQIEEMVKEAFDKVYEETRERIFGITKEEEIEEADTEIIWTIESAWTIKEAVIRIAEKKGLDRAKKEGIKQEEVEKILGGRIQLTDRETMALEAEIRVSLGL